MSCPETVGRERGEPLGTNYLNLLFFVMFTTVQRFPLNVVFDSPGLYFALMSALLISVLNSLRAVRISWKYVQR